MPGVDYVQQLIFGDQRFRRYTQDSPVLPDVWYAYCAAPGESQKLLLTPHFSASAGALTVQLRDDWQERNEKLRAAGVRKPRMAYNQLTVAVEASFEDLVFLLLPRTTWWQRVVQTRLVDYWQTSRRPQTLARVLRDFHLARRVPDIREEATCLWMAALIGAVLWAKGEGVRVDEGIERLEARSRSKAHTTVPPLAAYRGVAEVLKRIAPHWAGVREHPDDETLWLVNLDRPVETAQLDSVCTVKADAACRLFEVDCSAIRWAVLDSGIDATHPAFLSEPGNGDLGNGQAPNDDSHDVGHQVPWHEATRVKATYDFSRVRFLLDLDWVEAVVDGETPDRATDEAEALAQALADDRHLERDLQDLRLHLRRGRQIDWGMLDRFLRIPHEPTKYEVPTSGHGTHVAGILGGRQVNPDAETSGGAAGMCPDIGLYDLRVIDRQGAGDEFYVISALQFVRHLNSHQDYQVVHGANLSLSIRHEVRSYACGATPVCQEAERLMSSGVVVVAAAGNRGYQVFELADQGRLEGFLAISITDPGNAEKIITVGATHRSNPHTYGVSYFSSRGPTGDGRAKPDLVAPGEKIVAPVPGRRWEIKDGTSMAAPHVSGAAAMVLARHGELQGNPDRVKEILCAAATDLGREPYFQGHGLVDVLRALQSV
ncbi:MAG: S8 family peptidase [Thermoanaerobaculia bacterium]|nr:S8 family peptidase [Thermoanaerobaculia bacterium]